MASKRMFARSIVGSSRFLRMSATARLLYFDLGMNADDDGFTEAFVVMRMTGATETDLQELVDNRLVRVVNDDQVAFIVDWKLNNTIRADRHTPSIYQHLLPEAGGNQMTTTCHPDGCQVVDKWSTQVSIDKGSIDQSSLVEGSQEAALPPPSPSSESDFVPPTVGQVADYCRENGLDVDAQRFVDYYASRGWVQGNTPIRAWKPLARNWAATEYAKPRSAPPQPVGKRQLDEDEIAAIRRSLEESDPPDDFPD